jgi:octaprenyl-diphosphate synthase
MPLIKAVARADTEEKAFWVRTIEKGRQEDGDLETAIALLKKHDALSDTSAAAHAESRRAKEALAPLPEHPVKDMLIDLADYVVERIN